MHVIITGGSSGIGLALARIFVARGDAVSLIARRPDVLQQASAELIAARPSARIHVEAADVTHEAQIAAAIIAAKLLSVRATRWSLRRELSSPAASTCKVPRPLPPRSTRT